MRYLYYLVEGDERYSLPRFGISTISQKVDLQASSFEKKRGPKRENDLSVFLQYLKKI